VPQDLKGKTAQKEKKKEKPEIGGKARLGNVRPEKESWAQEVWVQEGRWNDLGHCALGRSSEAGVWSADSGSLKYTREKTGKKQVGSERKRGKQKLIKRKEVKAGGEVWRGGDGIKDSDLLGPDETGEKKSRNTGTVQKDGRTERKAESKKDEDGGMPQRDRKQTAKPPCAPKTKKRSG